MITQKELNQLFEKYVVQEEGDPIEDYEKALGALGPYHVIGGSWKQYGSMVDDVFDLLIEKTGAVVLENPMYEQNSDMQFLVFFPNESLDKA